MGEERPAIKSEPAASLKGAKLGPAKCAFEVTALSERSKYVNQDYVFRTVGRPHRAVNVMFAVPFRKAPASGEVITTCGLPFTCPELLLTITCRTTRFSRPAESSTRIRISCGPSIKVLVFHVLVQKPISSARSMAIQDTP